MAGAPFPDIDRILESIRAEARARGSKARAGNYSLHAADSGALAESHGMQRLELRHVADFLALPLDVFIVEAYRATVGRDPDAAGAAHYQRMLLRGKVTRVEVLGRLAFSPESRRRNARAVAGVAPALALALAYRLPLVGPLLALAARAARLPAHWQDRSVIEAAALASGSWMKR